MKKTILILMFPLMCNISFGQNKADAEKLVDEGIPYHDKGDFDGAISRYDKALDLDKDNLLALSEKAYSLLSLSKYEEAILNCKKAIKAHPKDSNLKSVYVTYGNALDSQKKTDQAFEIYNEGLKLFPEYYQLYFNKGVTYASVKKTDEAIACFQNAIKFNPKHASSHNAIAKLEKANRRIPAILAFCRFLVVEPQTKRAEENLASLRELMKANVKQTGEKSISVTIDSKMFADTTSTGKPKENNFSSTDLISTMDISLDYDEINKNKTEVENFIRKMETICASLAESKKDNSGFYWSYYVPYFIELKKQKLLEPFAYIVFASSTNEDVQEWIKNDKTELDRFYEWSKNFQWKRD
ncbi:tetratricopeptide repeat protein [Flavobacterium sp. j3]|uniref:Tetratricopeptide repeat protein n=1 Tax=Flavobacterium aureirubrum TaxID=3133147 RepID=A0ABU9NDG8_9FLAO